MTTALRDILDGGNEHFMDFQVKRDAAAELRGLRRLDRSSVEA
jgi:hypothetical protein